MVSAAAFLRRALSMKPGTATMRESLSFRVLTGPPSAAETERTVLVMDNRNEIRDFLTSRRARITPEQAGLPAYGGNRRVAGLRREEAAMLAGVSVDRLGRVLYSPVLTSPAQPANPARFLFLDPGAAQFYLDWERQAQDTVALLRSEAGRSPHDRALSGLIGELATRSETFRTWWAAHNVRFHRTGVKRLHHPVVGDLTLTFEALDLAADAGLRISAYTAEPGSASEDALNLLASWAATIDQAETAHATDGS
jgi:hypothetical protein